MDWMEKMIQEQVDNRVNQVMDGIITNIDDRVTLIVEDVTSSLVGTVVNVIVISSAVAASAVLGYIVYNCIRMMFFQKEEDFQRILFGGFWFLIIRVFGTIVAVKLA